MKKLVSFIVFATILTSESLGGYYLLKNSISKDNNIVFAASILKVNSSPKIAINSTTDTPILGVTDTSKEKVESNISKCRPQLVLQHTNARSVTNFMTSMGKDPSFSNRKQLAESYGIDNYTGTADQNKRLIYLLTVSELCQN